LFKFSTKTVIVFLSPFGDLGATYDVHLRLIEKPVVDFLFVLIDFFSQNVTADALRANIDKKICVFAPTWPVWPKISGKRGRPTNHSSSQKTTMNGLSCGVRMWAQIYVVLSQSTRQTDWRIFRSWLYCALHYIQSHGKNQRIQYT